MLECLGLEWKLVFHLKVDQHSYITAHIRLISSTRIQCQKRRLISSAALHFFQYRRGCARIEKRIADVWFDIAYRARLGVWGAWKRVPKEATCCWPVHSTLFRLSVNDMPNSWLCLPSIDCCVQNTARLHWTG